MINNIKQTKQQWHNRWGEEWRENCNREGGKLKMEGRKVTKWGRGPFAFHFFKLLKFVLGPPKMEIFYREKAFHVWEKAFHVWKKIRKNNFAPSLNVPVTPLLSSSAHGHMRTLNPVRPTPQGVLASIRTRQDKVQFWAQHVQPRKLIDAGVFLWVWMLVGSAVKPYYHLGITLRLWHLVAAEGSAVRPGLGVELGL